MRKKSVGRTNFEESFRLEPPVSEKEHVPLQSINPLAIEVYNPKNVPPVESIVSTKSDTSCKYVFRSGRDSTYVRWSCHQSSCQGVIGHSDI